MQNDKEKRQTQYGILQSDNDTNIAQGGGSTTDFGGTVYSTAPLLEVDYDKDVGRELIVLAGVLPYSRNGYVSSSLSNHGGKAEVFFNFTTADRALGVQEAFEEQFRANGIPFVSKYGMIVVDINSIASLQQIVNAKEGISAKIKTSHPELYPKESIKTANLSEDPSSEYMPISAPKENIDYGFKETPEVDYTVFKNIAKFVAFALVVAAVITACVFAFPAVAAGAGATLAAIGLSAGGSLATIGATTFGITTAAVAGGLIIGEVGARGIGVLNHTIMDPKNNFKILNENFPETNQFLKLVTDKHTLYPHLEYLINNEKVQDLSDAIKKGDVGKIQEILPNNKDIAETQNALNKVMGSEQVQQVAPKAKAVSMEALKEARTHAATLPIAQDTPDAKRTTHVDKLAEKAAVNHPQTGRG